jgi:hypothetical protein
MDSGARESLTPGELANQAAVVAHDRGEAGSRAHALVLPPPPWFLLPPPRLVEEIGLGAHREKENEGVGWKMEKNGGIFSVV